jgi:nuclear pore complex protein Nup93
MSSLFAGLGQNKPAATSGGSLFGSTATSQAQPTSSLFNVPQPSQSTSTTGLFANLGRPATASAAPPGLSLGASSSQNPASTTAGTSTLFSGLGSLGGTAKPPTTQATSNAGLNPFASTGGLAQAPAASTPAAQPIQAQTSYFDNLLERGKKRNKQDNESTQFGELPALQLGLGDIARKVRNLGQGGPSAPQARDSRAYDLNSYNEDRFILNILQALSTGGFRSTNWNYT